MAKAVHLIFSLFHIALAQEVPFGILQYVQYISSFVFHSSLLTAKSIDLVVAHDGLWDINSQ